MGGGGEIFGRGSTFFCSVFCSVGGGVTSGMGEGSTTINSIGSTAGVSPSRGNLQNAPIAPWINKEQVAPARMIFWLFWYCWDLWVRQKLEIDMEFLH